MKFYLRSHSIFLFLFLIILTATNASAFPNPPKLILLIAIDQFRADYLMRFDSQFIPDKLKNGRLGGFKYLMSHGAYFPYGKYDILQSVTAPGHMTMSTGSYPYQSGISNNYWLNQETQKLVYCTEDHNSPLIGSLGQDPREGRSPRNLIGTTIGDQLKISGELSKTVSIALKDRAAILMGGHTADLAAWFDTTDLRWTSSLYYFPTGKLPLWMEALNQRTLSILRSKNVKDGAEFLATPAAGELTVDAVEAALTEFKLGKGRATDFLAVSFSNHDKAGHQYGPNSPQMTEMTLADDRAISRLLNLVNQKVPGGLKNVLIAFTGDHGVAPSPSWSQKIGLPHGEIDEKQIKSQLSQFLGSKFGKPHNGEWVTAVYELNFYLNRPAIHEKDLALSKVESAAKGFLAKQPGVAHVFSSTDYSERKLPPRNA